MNSSDRRRPFSNEEQGLLTSEEAILGVFQDNFFVFFSALWTPPVYCGFIP